MSSDIRTATVPVGNGSSTVMALDLPASWSAIPEPGPVLAAFSDGRALSPGIATTAVITADPLPEGTALEPWQQAVRTAQLTSLPDLQVLDDRRLDAVDGSAQWYCASVMTDQNGVTVLTRRFCRTVPGLGLTLTLTTLPLVDAQHADRLDAIAESWRLSAPAEDGADDDQA
ncbi:DcrB-related protein [Brachybacterium sp. YJGR34]|uniref:DcrB-related protein n=1 Tax=Brachybacterium sp. YJGR34 TaxID=2059911 RepID=UPI000E0AAD40|nr:DcrB-related protein [Brachybacterium sp. YJGR34]